jgi:hypothetical protein
MIEQLSELSDFTTRGIKALILTFIVSFLLGGIVAIIGFCMVVDVMAGR